MKLNITIGLMAVVVTFFMTDTANAQWTYGTSGRVFETIQQCESARQRSNTIGTGLGAVIGGAAGNGASSNNNQTEMTIGGAAIGAVVGSKVAGANSCRRMQTASYRENSSAGNGRCDYGTRTLTAPDGRVISRQRVRMCREPGRNGWYIR